MSTTRGHWARTWLKRETHVDRGGQRGGGLRGGLFVPCGMQGLGPDLQLSAHCSSLVVSAPLRRKTPLGFLLSHSLPSELQLCTENTHCSEMLWLFSVWGKEGHPVFISFSPRETLSAAPEQPSGQVRNTNSPASWQLQCRAPGSPEAMASPCSQGVLSLTVQC